MLHTIKTPKRQACQSKDKLTNNIVRVYSLFAVKLLQLVLNRPPARGDLVKISFNVLLISRSIKMMHLLSKAILKLKLLWILWLLYNSRIFIYYRIRRLLI